MTTWVVIPVKPPGEAKSRLSEALDEDQRAALAEAMLAHVFNAASHAANVDEVALIGPSRLGLPAHVPLLNDPGGGLNRAASSALLQVTQRGASRIVILFADLPRITIAEAEQLAGIAPGVIAIAPDRHGTGTNALSIPIPLARNFAFAFGPGSFAAHCAEAERLGLAFEIIHSPGLAHDVDLPEDLADAAGI